MLYEVITDFLDGICIQDYPPPTGGKMPTLSPPFRIDVNSALAPSIKTSLTFSGGRSRFLVHSRAGPTPRDIRNNFV